MQTLYVIDAVNFLFRSYYAIKGMTNPKGESTGALYGLIRSIYKLISDFSPTHLVAVFDGPRGAEFRKKIYADYKANRTGMPDDLVPQLQWALEFCEIAGIPFLSVPGVEADDVMGSIADWAGKKGVETFLCSSDKDLCQLVTDKVKVLSVHKNNRLLDREGVKEVYGVFPEQVIDLLAMMGDTSDNIPGLPGIGPKTASGLLEEFGTLEFILDNPEKLTGKKQETVREGKEIALISKELATIHKAVPFPKEDDFFRLKEPDLEKVKGFYQQMRFMSLLKELNIEEPKVEQLDLAFGVDAEEVDYVLINEEKEFEKLLTKLEGATEICFDTETTGLRPMEAELVGVGLGVREKEAWYIPLNGQIQPDVVIQGLKKLLEDPRKKIIGHNSKYDLHILRRYGINIEAIAFDTILASYVLDAHKTRHNLDILSLEIFDKVKTPISDLIGKGKKQISMKDVPLEQVAKYCCEDVDYTLRLKNTFAPKIKKENLEKVYEEIELPLILVLLKMEERGIYVDKEQLGQMSAVLRAEIENIQTDIFSLAGETFNINSPKQLGVILFEKLEIKPAKKTATGYSTSADVLEKLKGQNPIIAKVLEYRGLEKLRSTYVEALPLQIAPHTGKIHCTFNQSVAATGRLSCQDPNLQNIPVRTEAGRQIRKAFKPLESTASFLSADYSQIELRLLAHFSEDPTLIAAFEQGEDIHTYTAALVYGKSIEDVSSQERFNAKAVNFGILYGQQAFGLSQELGISFDEAKTFIQTYFARYPKVKEYLEWCKQQVAQTGVSLTLTGRKRPIPEINNKNPFLRAAAERLAVNTPLQGTQADIIKMAMIEIDRQIPVSEGKMILQIHDELIFEVPDEKIEALSTKVKGIMEEIVSLKIPLVVDISVGKNWSAC